MCTLTFLPKGQGYLVGMNRDELRSRPAALPPESFEKRGVRALYPRESAGGTWIACNGHGNALALLNWNDAASFLEPKRISRGVLIPELIHEADSETTARKLAGLSLAGIHPFRLIGAFRGERILREWRWNGAEIRELSFQWELRHWFSSSLSDSKAEEMRGLICADMTRKETPASSDWLIRLHRSHGAGPGPYSICVHRPDAATVSYTEVCCDSGTASLSYLAGSPCQKQGFDVRKHILLWQGAARTATV
jgi:hypothetical protein